MYDLRRRGMNSCRAFFMQIEVALMGVDAVAYVKRKPPRF
jgi:hypothetical protein